MTLSHCSTLLWLYCLHLVAFYQCRRTWRTKSESHNMIVQQHAYFVYASCAWLQKNINYSGLMCLNTQKKESYAVFILTSNFFQIPLNCLLSPVNQPKKTRQNPEKLKPNKCGLTCIKLHLK